MSMPWSTRSPKRASSSTTDAGRQADGPGPGRLVPDRESTDPDPPLTPATTLGQSPTAGPIFGQSVSAPSRSPGGRPPAPLPVPPSPPAPLHCPLSLPAHDRLVPSLWGRRSVRRSAVSAGGELMLAHCLDTALRRGSAVVTGRRDMTTPATRVRTALRSIHRCEFFHPCCQLFIRRADRRHSLCSSLQLLMTTSN